MTPETLKNIGLGLSILGLCGQGAALFLPARHRVSEKMLSGICIVVILAGLIIGEIGNSALSELNGPRHLTPDRAAKFTSLLLTDQGHSVVVVSPMLDHEADEFADQLALPLTDGKWTVAARVRNWIRPEPGVMIGRVDDAPLPGQSTLDAALTKADIKHTSKQITGDDTHGISPWFAAGTLYLLIGSKPIIR